jgi:hypothetical protein
MANAEALDAPEDLERELTDRFGAPPASVRNLLFVVRVRVLAKQAELASVQREESDGRPFLVIRGAELRDLRATIAPSARAEFARTDGITLGRNQLRLDLEVLGEGWREVLVSALESLAGAPEAVAV